jgi:hypothetical protein
MTYWPISSPSVFAATKHTNLERTRVSSDGLEDGARHDAPEDAPQSRDNDATTAQGEHVVNEEGVPSPRPRASDQLVEDDIHGEIIAIRVTRSGHMFATLTQSTLTIWQTKARLHFCAAGLLLIPYIAHGRSRVRLALQAVGQDIRPKYRHSSPSRFPDLCGADYARLPHHLLPCDRPLFPRIQNPVHKHTWRALEAQQHYIRLQAAAPA